MPGCGQTDGTDKKTATLDPAFATLTELQETLASGELTSEKLVQLSLDRIKAYDDRGPELNAMISINDKALETARALDAERLEKGARGPLHGIPVILKDNYDTADLPTTGGSAILAGSRPPDDAFVVQRLRDAGAIILGKANMSEFALSYGWLGYGSAVGQTRNPHNVLRDPSGSSGGSAVAVAAGYATLATGTDTAGSVRGPASVCGIVGIKPTMGLVSRDGIIPASLSFDVPGVLARSVSGAAVMLGVMAGYDPADPATEAAENRSTRYIDTIKMNMLKGSRLGVVRVFSGANADVDKLFTAALDIMRSHGAELVDVALPEPMDNLWPVMGPVVDADFGPQIEAYLSGLPSGAPRTLADLIARAEDPAIADSATPLNPARLQGFRDAAASGGYKSKGRLHSLEELIPGIRKQVLNIMNEKNLDALVFPTMACPASPCHDRTDGTYICKSDDPYTPCYLASTTGFPEISVPAGVTSNVMPAGISFLGRPFSEERLIGLGYDFEQLSNARRVPVNTPSLNTKGL